MSRKRQRAEARGRRAELIAAVWLTLKGYRILRQREKTPAGELDLIALRGGTLAIVEVKARPSIREGLEAVSWHQQKRLIRGAASFMSRMPSLTGKALRFDVVIIRPWRFPVHVRNAMQAEGQSSLDFN